MKFWKSADSRARMYCGDALKVLKALPSNSVHAVVTDPPAGISFMNKSWDHDKGGRDAWIAWMTSVATECLRVLKPGGHALVWALPRTSHWTATAWEDAGFEVRDCIYHVFGSGFPKSLDVSKAIDKAAGVEREVVEWRKSAGGRTTGANPMDRDAGKTNTHDPITIPATDAARQWDGWGTALKPAVECWWLLRKALSEPTIAVNVLKYGTGALNIDGCRIEVGVDDPNKGGVESIFGVGNSKRPATLTLGRWPANLIHDGSDEVLAEFPNSSTTGLRRIPDRMQQEQGVTPFTRGKDAPEYTDSGSTARFFYCAKPSRAERGEDNTHPTVKAIALMRYLCRLVTPLDGFVLDPFAGSGTTGIAARLEGFQFIGIESEEPYFEIAKRRIESWEKFR